MIEPTAQSIIAGRSPLPAGGIKTPGVGLPNWSLNQVLDAQVIRISTGDVALRINGQTFTPIGLHQFLPGTQRRLRVDALNPTIRLTVIDKSSAADSSIRLAPAMVTTNVAGSNWAASVASSPTKLATLLSVFHRVPESLAQHLSAPTLSSIYTLTGWIPNITELRDPVRIRNRFKELGQVLDLRAANKGLTGNGSLAQLLGFVRSNLSAQLKGLQNVDSPIDLAHSYHADKSLQKASLNAALFLIDEAVHQHRIMQQRTDQSWTPWLFHLPFRHRDTCRTLRFRLNTQNRRRKNPTKHDYWKLQCTGLFPSLGPLALQLGTSGNKCAINIHSSDTKIAEYIGKRIARLEMLLSEVNLRLVRLRSTQSIILDGKPPDSELKHIDESTMSTTEDWATNWDLPEHIANTLQAAKRENEIPQLSEFEMHGSTISQDICEEMPEEVYQCLACLFAFLLETANQFGEV